MVTSWSVFSVVQSSGWVISTQDSRLGSVLFIVYSTNSGAMERYYAGAGAAESLVIELPKGSYVPTFTRRETTPHLHERTHLEPGLVVVQFSDMAPPGFGETMAPALTESLIHA